MANERDHDHSHNNDTKEQIAAYQESQADSEQADQLIDFILEPSTAIAAISSAVLFGALLLSAASANSQEVKPIERTQSGCPGGYHIVMSECRPMNGARPARQQKDGRCPPGWGTSMGYCLKLSS